MKDTTKVMTIEDVNKLSKILQDQGMASYKPVKKPLTEGLFLCHVYPLALGCPAEGDLVVHQAAVGVVALYACHDQPCAAGQFKGV